MCSTNLVAEMADYILDYLRNQPEAEDTLDGIAEWWVLEGEIKRRRDVVAQAVTKLVQEGRLECVSMPHGEDRFRAVVMEGRQAVEVDSKGMP